MFILVAGLAFLDEEQDDLVVADEPERPRRRVGGPQRRRQQFIVRRLIGVGVGLAFLILIVIGIRGCLEARSDRALRNYDSSVATIMQQSEQSGKDFFSVLSDPSSSDPLQVKNQVLAQRDASSSLLDRADSLDTPGQMSGAQAAVEQTLTLRRNALSAIAASVTAAASRDAGDALTTIENAMGSLYASDILWTQIGKPEITQVLKEEGVDGQPLPPGNFMPANATDYLDQTTLITKLGAITGSTTATTGGTHGLQLDSTTIGGVQLSPDQTTTVPSDATEIDIGVTNSGESDESDISVEVTIAGNSFTGQLQSLSAGQAGTIKIPLTTKPTPGADTEVDVLVKPVANEALTENNTATYTVVFSS
jgi:CARDB